MDIGSWVWIGTDASTELCNLLGQIVKITDGHFFVFVPGIDSNKFNKESLSTALLSKHQDDSKIEKLFNNESQQKYTGINIFRLTEEDIKPYFGEMVECQYVPSGLNQDLPVYG